MKGHKEKEELRKEAMGELMETAGSPRSEGQETGATAVTSTDQKQVGKGSSQ